MWARLARARSASVVRERMAAQDSKPLVMVALLAVVGLAGGVAFLVFAAAPEPEPEMIASGPSIAEPRPVGEIAPAPAPRSAPTSAPVPNSAPQPRADPRNRMARDLERERIWSALRREHGLTAEAPGEAPSPSAAAQLPTLDLQYVESAINEQLIPIAKECYESALEDDPQLAGKLVTDFTIVGAQDVGGIVEEAEVNEASTLDSAFVRECMHESLMAVSFEPPEDGGRVEFTYAVRFEPD